MLASFALQAAAAVAGAAAARSASQALSPARFTRFLVPASLVLVRQARSLSASRIGAREVDPAETGLRASTVANAVPPSQFKARAAFRDPDAVYVNNLPRAANSNDVQQFFAKFADVRRVTFLTLPPDGRPRGYAFVHLRDPAQVDRVVEEANGKEMFGSELLVCRANEGRRQRTVFVSPLPLSVTAAEVAEGFRRFGKVEDVYIPTNPKAGKTAVHALVEFAEEAVAKEAAEATNGTQFLGRTIYAELHSRRRLMLKAALRIDNLPSETTVEQLREYYEALAPVTSVSLTKNGRGFVQFESRRTAQVAKNMTDKKIFLGRRLKVAFKLKGRSAVVFVGNLSGDCGAKALGSLCSEYGPVEGVSIHVQNNLAEGHGFVRLATRRDAEKVAAEINGVEFMGRNISASIRTRRFQVPV